MQKIIFIIFSVFVGIIYALSSAFADHGQSGYAGLLPSVEVNLGVLHELRKEVAPKVVKKKSEKKHASKAKVENRVSTEATKADITESPSPKNQSYRPTPQPVPEAPIEKKASEATKVKTVPPLVNQDVPAPALATPNTLQPKEEAIPPSPKLADPQSTVPPALKLPEPSMSIESDEPAVPPISTPIVPAEPEVTTSQPERPKVADEVTPPSNAAKKEKSFWEKLKFWESHDEAPSEEDTSLISGDEDISMPLPMPGINDSEEESVATPPLPDIEGQKSLSIPEEQSNMVSPPPALPSSPSSPLSPPPVPEEIEPKMITPPTSPNPVPQMVEGDDLSNLPMPSVPDSTEKDVLSDVKGAVKPLPSKIITDADLAEPAFPPTVETEPVKPQQLLDQALKIVGDSSPNTASLIFKQGETGLTTEQLATLSDYMHQIGSKDGVKLKITGHASSKDPEDIGAARRVSLQRVIAVRKFFIDQGFDAAQLTVQALGKAETGPEDVVTIVKG